MRRSFTLVELLTTIAIMAVLATVAVFFIVGYVQYSKETADRQTLAVINDALNRYKTQGGGVAALTAGTPVDNVIARLKTQVSWAGQTHQFLKNAFTVPAKSLSVLGSGHQYRFTRYNTYSNESGGVTNPNINSSAGGLVGWWKLDATNGGTDLSGNGNDCSALNGLTFGGGAGHTGNINGATSFVAPKFSRGALSIASDIYTISTWSNATGSSRHTIVAFSTGDSIGGYNYLSIERWNDLGGPIVLFVGNGTSYLVNWAGYPSGWAHCALVRNGSNISVYLNGTRTLDNWSCSLFAPTSQIDIGTRVSSGGGSNTMTGLIDDVRIYNRALSPAEIQQLYRGE